MTIEIRTQQGRITVGNRAPRAGRRSAVPVPTNDGARDEAVALLRQALSQLDASGALIAAAHVDQALVLLRNERPARERR